MNPLSLNNYKQGIELASGMFNDLAFGYATQWKALHPDRRIIGYMPIYIPREIFHAHQILPVGLFGAGDRIPVVRGDAFFQSYICHIPRTVIECALNGNYDHFDGYIFPAICDVIRNLSGIFRVNFKDKYIKYLDFPQNFSADIGGVFYRTELDRLSSDVGKLNGTTATVESLNHAITLYNTNRHLLRALDDFRMESPHIISAVDYYLIRRAGAVLTIEDYNQFLQSMTDFAKTIVKEPEDKIRVVVSGAFCEQPPLGLIKTIENAGCYIVDDDFQLGQIWLTKDIPDDTDDPMGALVDAYLNDSIHSSAVFEGDRPKGDQLAKQVRDRNADGVIFCAPSFCDPALLDRPLLERAMDKHHIRHSGFQYHENLGQFHVIKEQAGTFADMIKLWE
ncbi:MAG: 2-hydroxyacyl-CoA dehydratase [Candidatus Marinimicrobia bacterium]|nr:2-hydroxyacyl-CoA dehydratase [Candidatus Neomarinimicrobiota bacterium]